LPQLVLNMLLAFPLYALCRRLFRGRVTGAVHEVEFVG
jgi:hypothetical protein